MNHKTDIEHFMRYAYQIARYSTDDSTQNGAVLISPDSTGKYYAVSSGNNNFPDGFKAEPEHLERPRKYNFRKHAEWEAVTGVDWNLARASVLICPFAACSICARAIVMSGCLHMIVHKQRMEIAHGKWIDEIKDGNYILDCAGVTRSEFDGVLGCEPILADGKLWTP
ncbi:hypothetical protein LOC67_23600 [Stieleria sp. JC731]|uniref:hypothetical protein n=1 Tax=Pirellulaceae TaxID=2691357 RepID=UPI001E56B887|nr:hypothetical protein [Stieleria sp. JC731]MCC9603546.1 hypothetical protein [Stieleria sp. JC731]